MKNLKLLAALLALAIGLAGCGSGSSTPSFLPAHGKDAVQLPPAARRCDPAVCRDVRNKLPRLFR